MHKDVLGVRQGPGRRLYRGSLESRAPPPLRGAPSGLACPAVPVARARLRVRLVPHATQRKGGRSVPEEHTVARAQLRRAWLATRVSSTRQPESEIHCHMGPFVWLCREDAEFFHVVFEEAYVILPS